jgi:LEA14-like dessication related protein
MRKCFFFLFVLFPLLFSACKSPPSPVEPPPPSLPEQTPAAALEFERIEASGIEHIALHYRLTAKNPRPDSLTIEIRGWKLKLNDLELDKAPALLSLDGIAASGARLAAGPGETIAKSLVLELDISSLPESDKPGKEHEYLANLTMDLAYHYASGAPLTGALSATAAFPRIREPEFTITSIAIMQAELINTRFRVKLRIDNPNIFPVALSSLAYELYGEGRFWADGRERDALHVPAGGAAETELLLTMNFINMKRHLLDEIIAMRMVRYRFTGEAEVGTVVSWLPRFHMGFDHSGSSEVLK